MAWRRNEAAGLLETLSAPSTSVTKLNVHRRFGLEADDRRCSREEASQDGQC
jgi:hypothetical protein